MQFCASLGSITEAEAALTQADSLVNGMPADSARQWRVHHWLLTRLLQLWKGNTLALQQTGGPSIATVEHNEHNKFQWLMSESSASCLAKLTLTV